MKALVTGAAGFVGSTLSERLIAQDWDVVGVDAFSDYYAPALKRENLRNLARNPRFTLVEADLMEVDLTPLLASTNVIFHQAGQPGVRKSWGTDFAQYTRANIQVTQKLLEAAKASPNLQRFVYASSSSVYGDAESYPTSESLRPAPMSPYGVTKLAAEHLCTLYAKNYDVPTTSLRYFTVYGPRQRPDMAFTRFLHAANTGGTISIYGDGEQIRDFTFIDDIVEANVRAATTPTPNGAVMNVCGGSSVSVNQVLQTIEQITQRSLNVEYHNTVPGDVRRTGGDNSLIANLLEWSPETSVAAGLAHQWEWVRASSTTGRI